MTEHPSKSAGLDLDALDEHLAAMMLVDRKYRSMRLALRDLRAEVGLHNTSAPLDLVGWERRWEGSVPDISPLIAELRAARTREQRVRELCKTYSEIPSEYVSAILDEEPANV